MHHPSARRSRKNARVLAERNQKGDHESHDQSILEGEYAAVSTSPVRQDQRRTFPTGAGAGDCGRREGGRSNRATERETNFRKQHRSSRKDGSTPLSRTSNLF